MYDSAKSINRVLKTDLAIDYAVDFVEYTTASGAAATWCRVKRTATKSYSYENLTERGAAYVSNALVAKYTRPYYKLDRRAESAAYPQSAGVTCLMADIVPTHAGGPAWRVDVSLREVDERAAATRPADPASLFTIENARDYDEGDESLEIVSALYKQSTESVVVRFSADLPTGEIFAVRLQYKTSPTDTTWTTRQEVPTKDPATGEGVITILEEIVTPGQGIVRLVYGSIHSQETVVDGIDIEITEVPRFNRIGDNYVINVYFKTPHDVPGMVTAVFEGDEYHVIDSANVEGDPSQWSAVFAYPISYALPQTVRLQFDDYISDDFPVPAPW